MKFNILEKLKEIFLKKSEYKTEKTDFNISEESKLEKLNIGTCIMDNEEKEKFLSINTPKLVELYEKKISEEKEVKAKAQKPKKKKVNKTWEAFGKLKGSLIVNDPKFLL